MHVDTVTDRKASRRCVVTSVQAVAHQPAGHESGLATGPDAQRHTPIMALTHSGPCTTHGGRGVARNASTQHEQHSGTDPTPLGP
ncbi:hypothetical protein ACOMHN_061568 [Nucella lapillus]